MRATLFGVSDPSARVPVTVLTGFLGSGKTTLLNRILSEQHGRRIAVIENELGETAVEEQMVINAEEEIFEVNNGCICCNVRGDLIRILSRLMKRRDRFDHVLIETTGLADPGPVLQTFFFDDELREQLELDAVVTMVDAHHVERHLEEAHECGEQIAFADVVVLNKVDLVEPEALAGLEERIASINPRARIIRAERAQVDLGEVLEVGAFDLDRALEVDPGFMERDGHDHHHSPIAAIGLRVDGDLDGARFDAWLSELLQEIGPDVFRFKGALAIAGGPNRVLLQGVHMMVESRPGSEWAEGDDRRSEMVMIGRGLDRDALQAAFAGCAA